MLAFLRRDEDEACWSSPTCRASRSTSSSTSSRFKGSEPVELFGQTQFPPIGELPYLLTLGPHAFYWFALEGPREDGGGRAGRRRRAGDRRRPGRSTPLVAGRGRGELERALAALPADAPLVRGQGAPHPGGRGDRRPARWPARAPRSPARVLIVRVEYTEGEAETYAVPLVAARGRARRAARGRRARAAWSPGSSAAARPRRARRRARRPRGLPRAARRRRGAGGGCGARTAGAGRPARARAARRPRRRRAARAVDLPRRAEQHLGALRRVADPQALPPASRTGINPDLEIGRYLTERAGFAHTPPVAGALEYQRDGGEPATLAILHGSCPTRATPGSTRSTRSAASTSGSSTERIQPGAEPPEPDAGRPARARAAARSPRRSTSSSARTSQSAQLLGRRTGRAARGARGRRHRPGPRARAVHPPLPALGLPVDAQPHRPDAAAAAARAADAERARPRATPRTCWRARATSCAASRRSSTAASGPRASASTATSTSARCSTPAATS